MVTTFLIRSASVGVRPVVGSVVTSLTVKIPNCMTAPSMSGVTDRHNRPGHKSISKMKDLRCGADHTAGRCRSAGSTRLGDGGAGRRLVPPDRPPTTVLTAGAGNPAWAGVGDPVLIRQTLDGIRKLHETMAAASSRGRHLVIDGATHQYLHIEHPEAVSAAVLELIG
jgi:hypothetical protein